MATNIEIIPHKAMLTFDEAVIYTGFSKRYLYKLTAERRIPFYKPNGKNIFFDRKELEDWLRYNRIAPMKEITKKEV